MVAQNNKKPDLPEEERLFDEGFVIESKSMSYAAWLSNKHKPKQSNANLNKPFRKRTSLQMSFINSNEEHHECRQFDIKVNPFKVKASSKPEPLVEAAFLPKGRQRHTICSR